MSKISKACDISPSVRAEVMKRDRNQCIICGSPRNLQVAHYISRGRLGLGIPQNLAILCAECHREYDNGKLHSQIQNALREHFMTHYPQWDEKNLTYSKWRKVRR